jgi:hypothetical protein
MKNIIKKIGVFVFVLAFMVSTASTVFARFHGDCVGENCPPPAPWSGGGE